MHPHENDIRPLAKLVYAEEFEGDASPRTAAYSSVCEDLSTASLSKLSAEVEFCKRSIKWLPNLFLINKITKDTKQNYSVNSPLIVNEHLEYGRIFHKILEDAVKINDFSSMNTHPFIDKLPTMLQEKIRKNIDKLLNNLEFMALISQELKTEVPIGINLNDGVKIGRIDLLAIDTGKLTIIDYKSDANPPKNCQLVKESYIDQLNFYRHLVAKLYPDNEIICKILWLEDASFMAIM